MIVGRIDEFGRTLVVLSIGATANTARQEFEV